MPVNGHGNPVILHREQFIQWSIKTKNNLLDPDVINFGNIFEKPFNEIWNSPSYQEFRRKLRSDTPPEICIDCTSYYDKLVME